MGIGEQEHGLNACESMIHLCHIAFKLVVLHTSHASQQETPPSASEDDGAGQTIQGMDNLPPELQGQDLNPDDLPKIEGDDRTATERIIIVYRPEQKETLEGIIGIGIDKVVYRLDEILEPTKKEEERAAED